MQPLSIIYLYQNCGLCLRAACINYFSFYLWLVFEGGFYLRKYGTPYRQCSYLSPLVMTPEVSLIRNSWFHFAFSVVCKIDNTKSLFTPLKLGSIKWFRDEIWDICSAFHWHLLELTWWFLRKIKRPIW